MAAIMNVTSSRKFELFAPAASTDDPIASAVAYAVTHGECANEIVVKTGRQIAVIDKGAVQKVLAQGKDSWCRAVSRR